MGTLKITYNEAYDPDRVKTKTIEHVKLHWLPAVIKIEMDSVIVLGNSVIAIEWKEN